MKLLSYISIFLLPLMCSQSSDFYDTLDYEINGDSSYNESPVINIEEDSELPLEPSEKTSQKIIKSADLRFQTQDLNQSYNLIIKSIKANKGFIQDDKSSKSYNTLTRRLVVRMPSENFQTAIDSISKHVVYFDTKSISSLDVTEEFIDVEARLNAKKALEIRYLELLKKAKNIKEILDIERELSNIREEIEAKQGRLKYLKNKVSLSTLNIEFYTLSATPPVTISYGTKMWNAIKSGFNGISLLFLGILYVWPIILLFAVGLFLFIRWLKKIKK